MGDTSARWVLDTDHWPGPDRRRWNITRDLVEPSPDGRFACVLYSCFEIRLNCEVGLLTLLAGPPESPTVLLQPHGFTCLDWSPSPSAQWLRGSRFVAVTAYLYDARRNRVTRLALTVLDTRDHAFGLVDVSPAIAGRRLVEVGDDWVIPGRPGAGETEVRISPDTLTWTPWSRLRSTSAWSFSAGSGRFMARVRATVKILWRSFFGA